MATEQSKEKEKSESKIKTDLRQYQKKTFEVYAKEGMNPPPEVTAKKRQVDKFLSKAKEDQGPIQKIIQTMKRIPKVVYDKDGKAVKKDFLEVNSILYSKDWMGNNLPPVIDYMEGYHYEPVFNTTMKRDMETGDFIPQQAT